MTLYNTKYYDVIITEATIEGEDIKVPVYGVINNKTGIIEEKTKHFPAAIEIADEFTEYLTKHYNKIEGGASVSSINSTIKTVQ